MSSPAKQAAQQKKAGGGWGSLLSGAVAGLESRLDTILADDNEASAKARAAEEAGKQTTGSAGGSSSGRTRTGSGNLAVPQSKDKDGSRESREVSRTRANDRLAERLAKATAAKIASQASSAVPSRVGTPTIVESGRGSGEENRDDQGETSVPAITEPDESTAEPAKVDVVADDEGESSTLLASGLPINPARVSIESSRPSLDLAPSDISSRPSLDLPNGTSHKSAAELEVEISRMREEHEEAEKRRQNEMHAYLEKIDALQSKLQYLAKETVAAAKESNASTTTTPDSADKKLAEKDERIALLMEEGERLSKTELRHFQTIKKLRVKRTDDEKTANDIRKRLDRASRAENDLKQKLRKAETAERQANEKTRQISAIEKQVDELRVDRENAAELVRSLTTQLKEAKERAERAEKEAVRRADEEGKGKVAALENEVEDARIEKKLAEERAQAEVRKAREDAESQKQRFGVRELELKNEIAALDAKVEAMRSRAEEAASTESGGGSFGGEGNVALLRQVETLQRQYAVAKENWEVIEGSLGSQAAVLEKERDGMARREGDARKRAREAGVRARRAEEGVESAEEKVKRLEREVDSQKEEHARLEARAREMEAALVDARAEFERQKKVCETEIQHRTDEERARWQRNAPVQYDSLRRNEHSSRKMSSADKAHSARWPGPGNRITSHELAALHTQEAAARPSSRRSSNHPLASAPAARPRQTYSPSPLDRSSEASPIISRQESTLSIDTTNMPQLPPSIEVENDDEPFDNDAPTPSSPQQRTINDLFSATSVTASHAAGPSVQLVERMSAAVRRLESEKAASRDELARLTSQRDSARDEVVDLMREVEAKRSAEGKVSSLEGDLREIRARYEASLEMLGEREEEVGELKADVQELKRLYRELVDEKTGGG